MKLACVVVLYNPDASVEAAIASYIDEVDIVYAVDNSAANQKDRFENEKIVYLPCGENKGIAYALNLGAKMAIADGYGWLLTMDQDSFFEDYGLEKMKNFICESKNAKNEYDAKSIGIVSPFHDTAISEGERFEGVDSPAVVMTSGNIINLDAYKTVGGFKDWMFIDAVDFDFCLNLRCGGYQILRLGGAVLKHKLGNAVFKRIGSKKIISLNHSPVRRYYIVRNRHYLYDMYHKSYPEFCKAERKMTLKEAVKIVLCEKQKSKKLWAMFKGYADYKRGLKGKKYF